MERYDRFKLDIEFNSPTKYLNIHSLRINVLRIQSGMMGLQYNAVFNIVNKKMEWNVINKIIEDDRNSCPILYESFQQGQIYATCSTCKNNFDYKSLIKSFETSNKNKCPMCSRGWTDYTKYVNSFGNNATLSAVENEIVVS